MDALNAESNEGSLCRKRMRQVTEDEAFARKLQVILYLVLCPVKIFQSPICILKLFYCICLISVWNGDNQLSTLILS